MIHSLLRREIIYKTGKKSDAQQIVIKSGNKMLEFIFDASHFTNSK